MTENDERDEFQELANPLFPDALFLLNHNGSRYKLDWQEAAFTVWQAARAESRQREEALRAECEAAARYTKESPCDHDITKEQIAAYAIYEPFYRARLAAIAASAPAE